MLKRINITGNPNLGVYISVNDEIAIVPFNVPVEMESVIKETLEVLHVLEKQQFQLN